MEQNNKSGLRQTGLPSHLALVTLILASVSIALGACAYAMHPRSGSETFRLIETREQGTFTVGAARSSFAHSSEQTIEASYMTMAFAVPAGTSAGVWMRAFPDSLRSGSTDVARIRLRYIGDNPARELAAVLELKGNRGIQRIPLPLLSGLSTTEELLDWRTIGQLKECVVLVSRVGDGAPLSGILSFDVSFDGLPALRKLSVWPASRVICILLFGMLAAIVTSAPWPQLFSPRISDKAAAPARTPCGFPAGLKRDFVLGVSSVFLAIIALGIYRIGGESRLNVGWSILALGVAGGLLAELIKYGLTGKHLRPAEAFQDIVVTGLLSISSSSIPVLQAPAHWSHLLLLSSLVAAAAALLYHAANLHRVASSGEHLGRTAATIIAGAPYLVGSLLVLESAGLMQRLGSVLTAGLLGSWPALLRSLGGLSVIWAFNEAVANALAIATRRRLELAQRAHLMLFSAAVAAVASPWIADLGSGAPAASLPGFVQPLAVVLSAALSQAFLWPEVYLMSGMFLDALQGRAPSAKSAVENTLSGAKKGLIFGGVFTGILCSIALLGEWRAGILLAATHPLIAAILLGSISFPLAKTLIETFDGSQAFFRRVQKSYADPVLYVRGAAAGWGLGYALIHAFTLRTTPERAALGAVAGLAASAGVSLARDVFFSLTRRGSVQAWRVYLVQAGLGGFIGAGLGFYFDAAQVTSLLNKLQQYLSIGQAAQPYGMYALLSKWGHIELGNVSGGVRLLYNESLMGVITWAIPAWLFAVNGTFMAAIFRRELSPVAALFSKEGLFQLGRNTIQVFRWGLWMSPIIASFLRPMSNPTWYNQDGAIRTLFSIFHSLTSGPEAFHAWSLGIFISLLAYNSVRILIWLDHMGLRVATLVNLSFWGMDRLDRRLASFLGPAATAQCIPEGVKRFATWAPLLIPFYIPRGVDWDFAWSRAESLQAGAGDSLAGLFTLSPVKGMLLLGTAVVGSTALFAVIRLGRGLRASHRPAEWKLANACYETVLKENGEMYSYVRTSGYDVSRRSYDGLDPAGRALFLVDPTCDPGDPDRQWAVLGCFPRGRPAPRQMDHSDKRLKIASETRGIRAIVEIGLVKDSAAELWTIRLENRTGRHRALKLVPYLEWVLNSTASDRGHTQYNRLYPEIEYADGLQGVLAWHKQSKAMGFLAADIKPEGFLTSRLDFIGRAQSIASPRVLQTLAFSAAEETGAHPSFDPIGSLLVGVNLNVGETAQIRILVGLTTNKKSAAELIARELAVPGVAGLSPLPRCATNHPVRHGEVLPGTPQPYSDYIEGGRKLLVRTPLTPRPYDHTMSNALGHVMVVTNRGLHTSSNGNSQQNRLTPDWADLVTREVPGEAFYLYDVNRREWHSPTYHPLNNPDARYEAEFGVDGTVVYRMRYGSLETELSTFVPPDDPAGVYILKVRNLDNVARRIRVTPYFQIVLADQPENAGPLKVWYNRLDEVLYFENPRNDFRTGPAFVAMSAGLENIETRRGRFFGAEKDVTCPSFVRDGVSETNVTDDERPIAALLATLDIPPHGERTISVVLGQADNRSRAVSVARKYRDVSSALTALAATRKWWLDLMDTVQVDSGQPDVDQYLDWLKYQTLAERIWARRGFYQVSGAYGFRDQLQDCVNLIWMDPLLARRQIVLHAAQQFLEGDTVHWFHQLQDGRTGFAARTHASDNLLWLAWATAEYVALSGDISLLDERVPYLEAELPPVPLPAGKKGLGFTPLRSSRADSIYRHCLRAIDLVFKHRMGSHGLPLIGTGDWNDGLDEIGSEGKGESVWLGFFLHYTLQRWIPIIEARESPSGVRPYLESIVLLGHAIQRTWRRDRYLRAIHDDGTEIGIRGSGLWEIDALSAAWSAMSGLDPKRGRIMFDTAIETLEKDNTILLGWPPLREDSDPYLGRSSWYPEGVRENGMYCHGVQWLVGAARILAENCRREGDVESAQRYSEAACRLWRKISPLPHVVAEEIDTYGGQPNKQAADMVTALDPGRMGWHGYTGAAGWLFRQAMEGVFGMRLELNQVIAPPQNKFASPPIPVRISRDLRRSPLSACNGDLKMRVQGGPDTGAPASQGERQCG